MLAVQELMKEIYTKRIVHSDLDSSGENETTKNVTQIVPREVVVEVEECESSLQSTNSLTFFRVPGVDWKTCFFVKLGRCTVWSCPVVSTWG